MVYDSALFVLGGEYELYSNLVYGREKKVACPTGIESNQKPGRTRYEN